MKSSMMCFLQVPYLARQFSVIVVRVGLFGRYVGVLNRGGTAHRIIRRQGFVRFYRHHAD